MVVDSFFSCISQSTLWFDGSRGEQSISRAMDNHFITFTNVIHAIFTDFDDFWLKYLLKIAETRKFCIWRRQMKMIDSSVIIHVKRYIILKLINQKQHSLNRIVLLIFWFSSYNFRTANYPLYKS